MLLKLPNTFRAFYGSFTGLHQVQRQAVAPILGGRDLVIQAATGSGKSEAVLAPCLERVIQSGRKTAVLYIIPTRALAMDLKRRFEFMITERLDLNLALRIGDKKLTGGKCPDIMLTTPESLDVMLGSANPDLRGFLSRVGTVIIDEVHSFIYQYRGRHLVYLFARLERRTGRALQKIAMSATISRVESVIDFFGFHPSAPSVITQVKRKIRARLLHIKQEKTEIPSLVNDLYDTWQYRKILIFVNSRVACDRLFGIVNETGRFKGVSELHYSNLKPGERKKAETRFRTRPHALCIATSTLELGIDVGDVDAVLLYQPPGSVAAFLQRIGRANRREQEINFWGICAGDGAGKDAGDQLVRFLALLELSENGRVESHPGRVLPSVLSQQVISCLYEKKRLTLASLQSLFPNQKDTLPEVFASLEKKFWLKPSKIQGLFGGGWQYRNHLFDYKIWGNFPEAEEDYILEVSGKPVADIPRSIVSQMEVGDKIYLAGRLLRILHIDINQGKKVMARPSTGQAQKQLSWIGLGPPVSHEVAKAMGKLLNTGEIKDKTCLFSRTQTLFNKALEQSKKKVILKNGIEIVPGKTMPYRYRTFLGTMGNLLLEWSIREHLADEDLTISSDETGVESSHKIRFEALNLPVDREGFQVWVKGHFKILRSLVSLNLFCKTLPRELLIQELMDFLFDQKVASTFAHYLDSSSKIVSGDMAALFLGTAGQDNPSPCVIDIACKESLLEREKEKIHTPGNKIGVDFLPQDRWHSPLESSRVTLTATMVSDYFFHAQCQRRFYLKFFGLAPPAQQGGAPDTAGLRTLSMARGIAHEQGVLRELKLRGANFIPMDTTGPQEVRFNTFLDQLRTFFEISPAREKQPVFLSQCQLMVESLDQASLNDNLNINLNIKGVGVPDLLVLSVKEEKGKKTAVIEVGDIKSSLVPGFHHKWQIAFYALLLEKILGLHGIPARVAKTGFIITRASGKPRQNPGPLHTAFFAEPALYEIHEFDIKAYLAALPVLLKTLHNVLSGPGALADHRLTPHCTACDYFFSCYYRALTKEDIQFLPGLTPGELFKLRQMGYATMEGLHGALEKTSPDPESTELKRTDRGHSKKNPGVMETNLTLEQKKKFLGQTTAFLENKLFLKKKNTRLFPKNISHAFFIYTKKDPVNGGLLATGYRVVTSSGDLIDTCVWIMEDYQDKREAWQVFVNRISASWKKSISNGKGPHIFHFGSRSRQDILDWGEYEGGKLPGFLWQTQPSHWTDLGPLFFSHFYLPAPGVASLFTLAHVFGLNLEPDLDLDPPPTLFHRQGANDLGSKLESAIDIHLAIMANLYAKACLYLKPQWVKEWETDPQSDTAATLLPYLRFIKEEQRLQEEDILTLQELSLGERMRKFRALGHLRFDHTRLDHEGRFLYVFKRSRETRSSKFRPGDFLKLAPHGLPDIQTGFPVILTEVDMATEEVSLLSRSGKLSLGKHLLYSLEEDTSDWNQEKLIHVATTLFKGSHSYSLGQLLAGKALDRQPSSALPWLEKWLPCHDHGLNPSQQRALALPFQYRTSIIQGPPGTGKTHLLGWMLIALILQAHETQQPLRIGVSALTHQAIDTILKKVTALANQYFPDAFPGRCIKWGKDRQPGKMNEKTGTGMTMEFSDDAKEVLDPPWLILGATGYGFYQLFNSKEKGFPLALDWVIFDEASQVPLPQALLSLIYSRGNFLFLGDVHQLPPIVRGNYGKYPGEHPFLNQSILANFLEIYPPSHQKTLNITYRMNKEICAFPGKTWYQRLLCPADASAHGRLRLKEPLPQRSPDVYHQILDPEKPVVLVVMNHRGCSQKSDMEAELMAGLAHRLMSCHGVLPDQMALISPHRTQNNAILKTLEDLLDDTNIKKELGVCMLSAHGSA